MAKRKRGRPKGSTKKKPTKPETVPYPDSKKSVGDFEKKLNDQLKGAGGTETAKRGKGQLRGDEPAAPDIQRPNVPLEIIESILQMPFDLWSTGQKLPGLKLNEKESKQLAKAVKPLLDYYLPFIPEIGYAWGALVTTIYWITKPRLDLIAKARKEKEQSSSTAPVKSAHSIQKPAPIVTNFPKEDEVKKQQHL